MIFEAANLEYAYTSGSEPVLNIQQLQIQEREKVYIFGASGSGKTTLLEVLAGVLTPTKGEVKFLGEAWSALTPHQRDVKRADHMGYIFQSFNLIPYLSVQENIELPMHISRLRRERMQEKSLDREVHRLAQSLGIESFLGRKVTQLSVGQQQRVAVARALIGAPEVILADEPTSALDMDHRENFLKLLFSEAAKQKTTVLFVSHDRSIQNLFDRSLNIADLKRGRA